MARFTVDTASQLTAEGKFDDARPWAREAAEMTKGFDDGAWHACARGVQGRLWLKEGDHQRAAGELRESIRLFNVTGSKKVPHQRVMFSKDLVMALARCGDEAGAAETRTRAVRECEAFGFAQQRLRLRELAALYPG